MASDTRSRPSETEASTQGSWESSPRQPAASGETSVPEAPPKSQARTRVLDVGSIAGTLCADPQMRFSQNGKAIVRIRVAVSKRTQDPDTGQWSNDPAQFHDLTVWGKQGENVMECLRKGDRVVANGMWQETVWTGNDNEEHTTRALSVRDIGPSLMFRAARPVRNQEGS